MNQFIKGIRESFRTLADPRTIAFGAMLIALNVILTRYLSVQTLFLRIGFGFLPVAIFSMLFGPVPGAIAAALGDVVGFMIAPVGTYFPGFTASAFLLGLIYGIFFYRKNLSLVRIILACLLAGIVVDLTLNTIWLSMLYGTSISAILVSRLIKFAITLPIQVALIYLFQQFLGKGIKKMIRM